MFLGHVFLYYTPERGCLQSGPEVKGKEGSETRYETKKDKAGNGTLTSEAQLTVVSPRTLRR